MSSRSLGDVGARRQGPPASRRGAPGTPSPPWRAWAALCQIAPATSTPSKEVTRAELLKALPGAVCSPANLGAWLLKAFDAWSGPDLAKVLELAGRDVAAAVATVVFPELASDAVRRCKRRHTALVDHLRPAPSSLPSFPAPAPHPKSATTPRWRCPCRK